MLRKSKCNLRNGKRRRPASVLQPIPEDNGICTFEDDLAHSTREKFAESSEKISPASVLGNITLLPLHSTNLSLCESSHTTLRRINKERLQRGLKSFQESQYLTMLATKHARTMAKLSKVFHSVKSTSELMRVLHSEMVAENIQRGDDPIQMHQDTVVGSSISKMNILSNVFSEYGSASVIGDDGKIYLCQLFRH